MSEFFQPLGKVMFVGSRASGIRTGAPAGYSINRSYRGREGVSFRQGADSSSKRAARHKRHRSHAMSDYNEAIIGAFEEILGR